VVEDVLAKVDKFKFCVVEEDEEVPLILYRPFMETARIIIDVDEGELQVRVQDDEVTFNPFNGLKNSNAWKEYSQRDATKGAFPTKEKLDLPNLIEEVIHHHIPKTVVHLKINRHHARLLGLIVPKFKRRGELTF